MIFRVWQLPNAPSAIVWMKASREDHGAFCSWCASNGIVLRQDPNSLRAIDDRQGDLTVWYDIDPDPGIILLIKMRWQ